MIDFSTVNTFLEKIESDLKLLGIDLDEFDAADALLSAFGGLNPIRKTEETNEHEVDPAIIAEIEASPEVTEIPDVVEEIEVEKEIEKEKIPLNLFLKLILNLFINALSTSSFFRCKKGGLPIIKSKVVSIKCIFLFSISNEFPLIIFDEKSSNIFILPLFIFCAMNSLISSGFKPLNISRYKANILNLQAVYCFSIPKIFSFNNFNRIFISSDISISLYISILFNIFLKDKIRNIPDPQAGSSTFPCFVMVSSIISWANFGGV